MQQVWAILVAFEHHGKYSFVHPSSVCTFWIHAQCSPFQSSLGPSPRLGVFPNLSALTSSTEQHCNILFFNSSWSIGLTPFAYVIRRQCLGIGRRSLILARMCMSSAASAVEVSWVSTARSGNLPCIGWVTYRSPTTLLEPTTAHLPRQNLLVYRSTYFVQLIVARPEDGGPAHHILRRQHPRAVAPPSAAAGLATSKGWPGPISPQDGAAAGGTENSQTRKAGEAGEAGEQQQQRQQG